MVCVYVRAGVFMCWCVLVCVLQGIVINLTFDSEETRQIGVDRHVCELQLLTCCFAAIAQVRVHYAHCREARVVAVLGQAFPCC